MHDFFHVTAGGEKKKMKENRSRKEETAEAREDGKR